MATTQPDPEELRDKHTRQLMKHAVAASGVVGALMAMLFPHGAMVVIIITMAVLSAVASYVIMHGVADYVEEYNQHYE